MKVLIVNCSPVKNGATARIIQIAKEELIKRYEVKDVCIDDYRFSFCTGCRRCHTTAQCIYSDGVDELMEEFEKADVILCVSPSYWADVPGQFKAFIDRCTPYSNTHNPHKALSLGKKGYAIALRTGGRVQECEKIAGTIEHFYGHLDINYVKALCLTKVEYRDDVVNREEEIRLFCNDI